MISNKKNLSIRFFIKYKLLFQILAVLIGILILLFLPYIFVYKSWGYSLDSDKAYRIGGAISGLTAPIISVIVGILTYLAFIIQVRANKQVTNDLKLGRFETQFYQMLDVHRENVKSFRYINPVIGENDLYGREAFEKLVSIVRRAYNASSETLPQKKLKEAYLIIFNGNISSKQEKNDFADNNSIICIGHALEIAHYIRQLFHTVKFIVNNDDIGKYTKHNYLRQLRAQMPTDEQIMLFYNWYSGTGSQWENEENKFFTEYRMIHNIFPDRMPIEIKKQLLNKDIKGVNYGKNSLGESIFEFQDWIRYIEDNK